MDEVKARLAGPALHMPGVQLDVEDAIEQVKERYPDRSHCVVSDWVGSISLHQMRYCRGFARKVSSR